MKQNESRINELVDYLCQVKRVHLSNGKVYTIEFIFNEEIKITTFINNTMYINVFKKGEMIPYYIIPVSYFLCNRDGIDIRIIKPMLKFHKRVYGL